MLYKYYILLYRKHDLRYPRLLSPFSGFLRHSLRFIKPCSVFQNNIAQGFWNSSGFKKLFSGLLELSPKLQVGNQDSVIGFLIVFNQGSDGKDVARGGGVKEGINFYNYFLNSFIVIFKRNK